MANQAPSSSITHKWTYDVFLSFQGEDTRLGFTSHLHNSLCQSGIHAFLDDDFIRIGENIKPALFKAIEESRIAIIVFSENYANSTFCLEELVKILECFKEESRLIYPVFYHVDPSELRRPRGSYEQALARLEKRFKDNIEKVEKWRLALSQVADFKGCHLKPKIENDQECIARITNEVTTRINQEPLHVTDYPVGLVSRVKEAIACLDLWSTKEVKMIGIWGAGGIGKSTIARAIYNSIADNFESSCFLSNVRKQSKEPNGLSHLQETLLCKLVMEKDLKLGDYHEGIPIIKHRLRQKKILLILDDVDKLDQLEALAGSCSWFYSGSRIIITTRNKQLLQSHGVKRIYDVKGLNDEESLELLCWYAFRKENTDSNFTEVCNRVIQYSCGFPIALEVMGSNLRGKGVNVWCSALDQFKRAPHRIVLYTLKLSYDSLEEVEQQVFLDLACFFNGEKLAYVNDILLRVREIEPNYAIEVLIDKSLIKIEQGCVTMHDLLEDLGKEIVRRESNEPGNRSRLWFYKEVLHVLREDTGTNKVEAIILDLPESIKVRWSGKTFMKMKNLKMLVIRKACFSQCPKYLPNSIRWLEWKGYPFKYLPHGMFPMELVHLNLSLGYCELLQPFDKRFHNLISMNLRSCKFLQQIPDLFGVPNLRELWLDDCTNLIGIHDSVGCLNNLEELSAMRCKSLKILPSCLRLPSLKHLNLFGCSSLQRFPEISVMMEEMHTLDLDKTSITELPSSIRNLIGLETLNMEECANLKQLPASICTLPNLQQLKADSCEGISHFKLSEDGDETSFDCSTISLKMEQLCFSNCNLSNDSLAFSLPHFTNMVHLDLSFNNFTILPECVKEHHNLKYLLLDNCNQLQHIVGMPPNLEKFSAICCTSLTKLSKSKVLKEAFNFQPGKRNFIFPEKKFPERLHNFSRGTFMLFWVRNVFPTTFLWILVEDDQDYVYNCQVSVHINDTKLNISSKWHVQSTIKTGHIYICDMQSIILTTELPLLNKWNEVKVSIESKTREIKDEKEIYFGVHVYNLQNNLGDNIRFLDPRRYHVDYSLLQIIQEQEDLEELEDDMNLDLNSTKSADSSENSLYYQAMAIQVASPSSSHIFTGKPKYRYDVFLSFRGKDTTRQSFTDFLYEALRRKGINVFIDDKELGKGEEISPSLLKAIERSTISIIVFSKNYANCTWCLEELAHVIWCKKHMNQLVMPIFYKVDPMDVLYQRNSFGDAMAIHEDRFKDDLKKVQKWRSALSEAASLSLDWLFQDGYEVGFIERIVKDAYAMLPPKRFHSPGYTVGLEPRMEEVISLLNQSEDGVCMLGIYGTSGIGKTTLAKAVYNSIFYHFDGACFLFDVKEASSKDLVIVRLQQKLLSDILEEKVLMFGSVDEGISRIKHRLSHKRVLLVLDDVDELKQLEKLAGGRNWFGCGSKVIITTRNKQLLLIASYAEKTYEMMELNELDSLELFCWHAFHMSQPPKSYQDMCNCAIVYAHGLPLALRVIGSNLADKNLEEWRSILEQYKRIPERTIHNVLKISYDCLQDGAKHIFLDIACFQNEILLSIDEADLDFDTRFFLDDLVDKSLITVSSYDDGLSMHDLIGNMGKEIVRQEAPSNPEKRSRIWYYTDVLKELRGNLARI